MLLGLGLVSSASPANQAAEIDPPGTDAPAQGQAGTRPTARGTAAADVPAQGQAFTELIRLDSVPLSAAAQDRPASAPEQPTAAQDDPVSAQQPVTPQAPTLPNNEQQESIARYEALVTELEAAGGAHAEELVEVRFSLGLLRQRAGDHRQALAALQGALQSVRVNEGLYSMSQVAILEAIIDSNVALGARDELRRNYEYLFWLHQRNYGERNAGLVPVIKKVGQWYFDLYNFSPPATTVEPLIAADDLYARALDILPEDAPSRDRVDILYKVAVINHHVAEDVLDPMLSHREIREAMIPHGRATPYLNEVAVRQYYADQSFYKGKRSLQRIIEIYEKTLPAGITDYARALVFMGDWLTVQRRVWDGARMYQRAWTALAGHDADLAQVDELFDEPQPIEQLPIPGEAETEAGPDSYYVDALLDVPESGWPRNIRIQAIHPSGETSLIRRAERGIAATRYRPRYRDGRPVASADVPLRFVFKHKDQPGWLHF